MKVRAPNIHPFAANGHFSLYYRPFFSLSSYGNPLDWHSWLAIASPEQQAHVELRHYSVDWTDLDEGLDIQGMLMGIRPKQRESVVTLL